MITPNRILAALWMAAMILSVLFFIEALSSKHVNDAVLYFFIAAACTAIFLCVARSEHEH